MTVSPEALFMLALALVLGIAGYLARERLTSIKASITLLFSKRDELAEELATLRVNLEEKIYELRLELARNHYVKEELDDRFDEIKQAFTTGFDRLGEKFDRMSDRYSELSGALLEHIRKEDERNGKP